VIAHSYDNHSKSYSINVSYVEGDALCTPGGDVPCYDVHGAPHTCNSTTLFPVDILNMTTTCQTATSTPLCGFTSFGVDVGKCTCPICAPNSLYACSCPELAGQFGTASCDAFGKSLSQCNCNEPYPYAIPSPPSPPPPPHSADPGLSGGAWAAIGIGIAIVVAAAIATPMYLAKKRATALSGPVNAGLLTTEAGQHPVPSAGAPAP